ncbi:MAG: hypothetical protein ACRBFS_06265 [Aureispira sp.]
MIKKILLLSSYFCWGLMACTGPNGDSGNANGKAPKELPKPDSALEFGYLLYDDDFNAVPVDEDPTYYTNDVLDSALIGLSYKLTNARAFAPGVFAIVRPDKRPTWYHVSLRALKQSKDMQEPLSARGLVVLSWERAGNMQHYVTYPIKDLLKQQNRQMIDKWETLETWHQVPDDVQEGDLLKIYVWNPEGGTIYVDDFMVTAWSKPTPPVDVTKEKMRLLVDQSYEHEAPSSSITTKYAQRGTYSNVIGNLEGYSAYGQTYETSAEAHQLKGGDALRIRFGALKQDKLQRSDHAALMVCSVERDGASIHWESFGINSRLWEEGQQLIKEWKELEWWQVLPQDLRPTDTLKIYVWNNRGILIYIDDLSVEVVETVTAPSK